MSSSSNQPGQQHAPGVKCIVAVSLTPGELEEVNKAKQLAKVFGFDPNKIMVAEQADNGKLVVITRLVTSSWRCRGCGGGLVLPELDYTKMWEVLTTDGMPFRSGHVLCDHSLAVFQQSHLIPLGKDMTDDLNKESLDTHTTLGSTSSISATTKG